MLFRRAGLCVLVALLVLAPRHARSEGLNVFGAPGLLTLPSARMLEPGTIVFSAATTDPYLHGTFGIQLAEPLYIGVRQSGQISSLRSKADKLAPGIDARLRLFPETAYTPEVSLGGVSLLGHKRLAGEYLAFSKRYERLAVTAGLGWGRFGSRGNIPNPLGFLSDHFDGERNDDDPEEGNGADDWFTGEEIGLFGGVEYELPFAPQLHVLTEWGADGYDAERTAFDFDRPAPWAAGLRYEPFDFLSLTGGIVGGDKVLLTLSIRAPVKKWPGRPAPREESLIPMRPYRTGLVVPARMILNAENDGIALRSIEAGPRSAEAAMDIDGVHTLPWHLRLAVKNVANHSGEAVEAIDIRPHHLGLKGPLVRLNRRDMEQTLARGRGSPQEIWRNVAFNPEPPEEERLNRAAQSAERGWLPRLTLALHSAIGEEDQSHYDRLSLIADIQNPLAGGFMHGIGLRLNLFDNLEKLRYYRTVPLLPVRSDIDAFVQNRLTVDRAYLGWLGTPRDDLHVGLAAGYLEEMYAGAGGSVLYRPFDSPWAFGAEAWFALKRDPLTLAALGLKDDHLLSGHLRALYEFPRADMTLEARLGRYLKEDVGLTLSLTRRFRDGLQVQGFVTATNDPDPDLFGNDERVAAGLSLSLPLGNVTAAVPPGSRVTATFAPVARDAGQFIDNPIDLYALSEPLSLRHMTQYWNEISE